MESEVQSSGSSDKAPLRLAIAYRSAGRFLDAANTLERLAAGEPNAPRPILLLGLTREDLADWSGARAAYARYLEVGHAADMKVVIGRRLQFIRRKELEAEVKATVANEQALSALEPGPGTIAVFGFLYQGSDTLLRPLGRALAELLTTDLSQTNRLHALERLQVQLLLDEIQLSLKGVVDPSSALRPGRMFGERAASSRVLSQATRTICNSKPS